jgi:hypothetical protein
MRPQTLEQDRIEVRDEKDATVAAAPRVDKPYAPPVVASFAFDPHDAASGGALTANG